MHLDIVLSVTMTIVIL